MTTHDDDALRDERDAVREAREIIALVDSGQTVRESYEEFAPLLRALADECEALRAERDALAQRVAAYEIEDDTPMDYAPKSRRVVQGKVVSRRIRPVPNPDEKDLNLTPEEFGRKLAQDFGNEYRRIIEEALRRYAVPEPPSRETGADGAKSAPGIPE